MKILVALPHQIVLNSYINTGEAELPLKNETDPNGPNGYTLLSNLICSSKLVIKRSRFLSSENSKIVSWISPKL